MASPPPNAPVVIRPAAERDLPALLELAGLAGTGLTTLPRDEKILRRRILQSVSAFERNALSPQMPPGGESYLFVLDDISSSRVIGTSGIVSKVGGFEPFYSYQVETTVFESKWIGLRKEVPLLRLHEEHDGPAEIGSLFLHPDHRHGGNGRLLQLVRFLFMAEAPDAFETTVVSEIRGVSDDAGRSPFWDAIGRHFFGIDFREADYLSVTNKKFIADLMPDHPIYIPLLPKEAQDVIGRPHPHSAPAIRNLETEGFTYANAVDIFDAGPVYACKRDNIRTVRDSRRAKVAEITIVPPASDLMMIGTSGLAGAGTSSEPGFRATLGNVVPLSNGKGVRLAAETAELLQLRVGQTIRYVELRKPATT